jgi:phosphate transport system permease protein
MPFTFLLLLPLAYVTVSLLSERTLGDVLGLGQATPSLRTGLIDGGRWLATLAAAAALAAVVAGALTGLGLDARGGVVSTYVQRNTLVVGFAMGFAVIPIIYTIAEDALNSVPEHLRAASLACGATPWQTATRVILPTAMSGVFAAIMVGMGRAVGETMIVVMAAGNTPILEWNIFSGLRALSANIAVELPEAVKDGTLYRTLFLAALTLFVMTFVVNTAAEVVRQRFRKRAVSL